MQEQYTQKFEDCNLYAGNLDEETEFLKREKNEDATYTNNTPVLTIFCCQEKNTVRGGQYFFP